MVQAGVSKLRDREVGGNGDSLGFTVWDYENTSGVTVARLPTTKTHWQVLNCTLRGMRVGYTS